MSNIERAHANLHPEDQFNRLFDTCCADLAVKTMAGTTIGGLMSLLFTHRRAFPLWMGLGFGLGAGYMSCQSKLRALTNHQTLDLHMD